MGCTGGCNGGCGNLECGTGPAGLDGQNAFTVTTADFVQPNVGSNVTISVSALGQSTGLFAQTGQVIFVEGGGYYEVVSATATTITMTNLAGYGNTAPAATVSSPAGVSPAGLIGPTGATGTAGANGTDGTTVLAYERDGGNFTSLTYTQIRGPYAIPANSWAAIGDTVRVKLLFHGTNDGTPDSLNHILFNFRLKIGTTVLTLLPGSATEYAIQSNFAFNGIAIELDLVAKTISPFVLEVVPRGNFFGLYSVGVFAHTPGTSGMFLASTGSIGATQGAQYQPPVFVTSGIDPAISNNFSVEGKHTVVGTGGGTTAEFACPFSLLELLKK